MGASLSQDYVIDACALIAFLRDEPGADELERLLQTPGNRCLMHAVNLAEVYYDTLRTSGQNTADELFNDLKQLPIDIIRDLGTDMIKAVGHFKTRYRISFADSFVLALASLHQASVVSTDHHEFNAVEQQRTLDFHWLR